MKRVLAVFLVLLFACNFVFAQNDVNVHLFWEYGCPHCSDEKVFLDKMQAKYTSINVIEYETSQNSGNLKLLRDLAEAYSTEESKVPSHLRPSTFIGGYILVGYGADETTGAKIEEIINICLEEGCPDSLEILNDNNTDNPVDANIVSGNIELPFIGKIDSTNLGLPLFTVILGFLDGFNPCAFFVLLFLLSLLVHAKSRKKMLLIGGIFVFFSAFIYFLAMAFYINIFEILKNVLGGTVLITGFAAIIALIIGTTNVKDFFFFKKGISFTIPDWAKPKLFARMRNLLHKGSLAGMIIAAIVLAGVANMYELICTLGFPIVYTNALIANGITGMEKYLYLILYNLVYVLPLSAIVLFFTFSLGSRKLSENEGQILKLISGTMMLLLGLVLLVNPLALNNIYMSVLLIISAIVCSFVMITIKKIFFNKR